MIDLSTVSTRDLQAELSRREGVDTITVAPYERVGITGYVGSSFEMYRDNPNEVTLTGPAIITVNID